MKIWVARIPEEGSHYEGDVSGEILQLENDPFAHVTGEVVYSLDAQRISEELIVRGTLSVEMDLKCTRCTDFFSTTVVDSGFLRAYPASGDTDSVDITEDMREDLLLYLPAFPLCRQGCKGLCAQCGANLNKGDCGCVAGDRPNPWSTLDHLNL